MGVPDQEAINNVARMGIVEDARALVEALGRVDVAKAAWDRYDGNPGQEIARELLEASRELERAMRRYRR